MQLPAEEPEGGPWRPERLTAVIEMLLQAAAARSTSGPDVVLAVDGRSSSGKTTLAARIQVAVAGSAVVHTDDIAWRHSRFGWDDLLIDGILRPVQRGEPVAFRPPRWAEHGRPGCIGVPAGCPLVIVEGVGAGRGSVMPFTGALIWVQSDQRETEQRNLARVGQPGDSPTVRELRAWQAEEDPFLARERPWERADLLVAGTPRIPFDPVTELVIAPGRDGRPVSGPG